MQSPSRFLFVVSAVVIGCSGASSSGLGGGGGAPNADAGSETTTSEESSSSETGTEQVDGACPSRPKRLVGSAGPGDECTKTSDCEPACCSCDEGSGEWLAAACIDGKCTSASKACSKTKKKELCEVASSSSSSSGSPKPPPNLDQQCGRLGLVGPSARACEDCWSVTCCAQKKWCADTPECGDYLSCRTNCPGDPSGPACQQCRDLYPVGATIIDGMVSCLGSSCDVECAQASMP